VLAHGERACQFCESAAVLPLAENSTSTEGNRALNARAEGEWRGELNQRLQAYRARRRKSSAREGQTALPFDDRQIRQEHELSVQVEEPAIEPQPAPDDFAFTIAIGRIAKKEDSTDPSLLIDVSAPVPAEESEQEAPLPEVECARHKGLYPVASPHERRGALLVDAACLAFAYGGFLALFGSLGGHFAFSKLSAAVCFFTFAFVYLQYFGLFTIFGGSTPGMMVCGLQVASFTGDVPTPKQYMLRAAGYLLSAGTCFLGFLWVLWDEDGLTWHDRLSDTYLTTAEPFVDHDASHTAAAR
jgi:uncharacterized RDD family membrane protein YckC